MKKLIIFPAIAISALLMADGEFNPPSRHGVFIGVEASHFPAQTYNVFHEMKSGSSMPGIHFGYLYEGPTGMCWKAAGRYHTDFGARHSSQFHLEAKYRFTADVFTIAPMFGLKSDIVSLCKDGDWKGQSAHGFIGLEVMKDLSESMTLGLEVKAKRTYSHNLVLEYSDVIHAVNMNKFNGIEIDLPLRITLSKSQQLEMRPIYNYAKSQHKIGMQAHLIHWF
jgi:hypothetical protein